MGVSKDGKIMKMNVEIIVSVQIRLLAIGTKRES